jgi:molybdenum cofactor cytidylyltransferase
LGEKHDSAVAAIILAAGGGTRFSGPSDTPKILTELAGKPLIRHVAEQAAASRARPVIVVVGAAAQRIEAALAELDCAFVQNNDPAAGMSRSLTLGLAAVPPNCRGAVILLADMPRVTAKTIDRLIGTFEKASPPPRAVVPHYQGRRGNPVLLARAIFREAIALTGDHGARSLLEDTAGILTCTIDDDGIEIDVDTSADLIALARQMREDGA